MRPLTVNVAELLRRPGTVKSLALTVTAEELGLDDERVAADAAVDVALRLESLTDGIVVTGTATVAWSSSCRRCLSAVDGLAVVEADELYQRTPTSEDAFPIDGEQIDLSVMVRELTALELPAAPLCGADCAGLCPVCGVNRNETACACPAPASDDRWAALDTLRGQLN